MTQRTDSQNNALHKDCLMVAKKLNAKNILVQDVLKTDFHLDWTASNVAAVLGVTDKKSKQKVLEVMAKCLNEAGYTVIPIILNLLEETRWTTVLVKELIWRSIQKSMFQKYSTTQLDKNEDEIGTIHRVMMRELGEKFAIEYHEFPNDPDKKNKRLKALAIARKLPYPKEELTPTF